MNRMRGLTFTSKWEIEPIDTVVLYEEAAKSPKELISGFW